MMVGAMSGQIRCQVDEAASRASDMNIGIAAAID